MKITPKIFSRRKLQLFKRNDELNLRIVDSLEKLASCVTTGDSRHSNGRRVRLVTGNWND